MSSTTLDALSAAGQWEANSDQSVAEAGWGGDSLAQVLSQVQGRIAPLWPLKDFVAVNPFVGMTDQSFLDVVRDLGRVRDGQMLMPVGYYLDRLKSGRIRTEDVDQALRQCIEDYPQWYAGQSVERMFASVAFDDDLERSQGAGRWYYTVAERSDNRTGSDWSARVTHEITKHCAAHYDEGQAMWSSPWKGLPLYEAWRQTAMRDRRMEKWGIEGFRDWVSALPESPEAAISYLLSIVDIPGEHAGSWLWCQALSVSGWASSIKYRVQQLGLASESSNDLVGLIAIRLAYDVALYQSIGRESLGPLWPIEGIRFKEINGSEVEPCEALLVGYWLQVSAEVAYRRELGEALMAKRASDAEPVSGIAAAARKRAQMVFCIDVRSEVFRRHLESVSDGVETFGFAGFFGLPMAYKSAASVGPVSQLPVLLSPSFEVKEGLGACGPGDHCPTDGAWMERRYDIRALRKVIKVFQASAASCFSFVEAVGLAYCVRLVTASLGWSSIATSGRYDGVASSDRHRLGPVLGSASGAAGGDLVPLDINKRAGMAESILKNLGLTDGFARLVVLCGHASETVNNPYRAGLDCGACGGHSGEPNARVAAALLNDPEVRKRLAASGVNVPQDVWFLAAVHNTTTDGIEFFDVHLMPPSHLGDLSELTRSAEEAGRLARVERGRRMGLADGNRVASRGRHWSEVRPEWGLAGNAALVVAPRSRTSGMNLDGRTFMHSYDHRRDVDGKVLELIMTAPMVVANWINMQYYASSVDNRVYGSGNKVLHNVVGQFGILEGNSGDLRTGLPWQSVHDGVSFQHEPLRLLVVIEAPRSAILAVIQKHGIVRDLVHGGWVSLVAIDNERLHRYASDGGWEELESL
jgi:uncharacterized protein